MQVRSSKPAAPADRGTYQEARQARATVRARGRRRRTWKGQKNLELSLLPAGGPPGVRSNGSTLHRDGRGPHSSKPQDLPRLPACPAAWSPGRRPDTTRTPIYDLGLAALPVSDVISRRAGLTSPLRVPSPEPTSFNAPGATVPSPPASSLLVVEDRAPGTKASGAAARTNAPAGAPGP